MSIPPGATLVHDDRPFELVYGGRLPGLDIAYETWGELTPERDNVVLVCPAFSAHSHANSGPHDPTPGWWEGMIGPGKALDTERFHVVCPSLLGGSYGTSGPQSIDPATDRPWGGSFPVVTVRDMVRVHLRLLELLGIERVLVTIGGSLGAMEVIELAIHHPWRTRYAIAASGCDRTRPYTAAIRHLGRRAIMLDPEWRGGDYEGAGPVAGLMLAREIGTLFYRSRSEFNSRFPSQPIRPPSLEAITFEVQSYLDHQGKKILGKFDANSYLKMSLAMDLHDVWQGADDPGALLEPVECEWLMIGCLEDALIPVDEQKRLHQRLLEAGKASTYREISSPIGHDAFLVEIPLMTRLVRDFLADA